MYSSVALSIFYTVGQLFPPSSPERSHLPKPWNANSTSPVPGPNHLLSVSMNLTTFCISHKWDTVFVFLWQTLHSAWYSQGSAMSLPVSEPPSFLRLMFHCKYILPFVCPFIHWWSLGGLPSLGHCEKCCNACMNANIYKGFCFHFPWIYTQK